jgi:iron complex transport system ATP-binding protein
VTNLLEKRHSDLEALSGGERQRVWIAMALAQRSEILCLDEPTTYLDIYYQIELLELVKSLNEEYGLTIIMVLHDINQAIRYSDHIILMKDGQIVAEGPPREVISKEVIKTVYGVNAIFKEDDEIGLYMMSLGI